MLIFFFGNRRNTARVTLNHQLIQSEPAYLLSMIYLGSIFFYSVSKYLRICQSVVIFYTRINFMVYFHEYRLYLPLNYFSINLIFL